MTMEIPTPACALVRNDTNLENAAAYTGSPRYHLSELVPPPHKCGGHGYFPYGSVHHRTTPSGSGKKRLHKSNARLVRRHCRQTIICLTFSEMRPNRSKKEFFLLCLLIPEKWGILCKTAGDTVCPERCPQISAEPSFHASITSEE